MIESGRMVQTFKVRVTHNRDTTGIKEVHVRSDSERDAGKEVRCQPCYDLPGWVRRGQRVKHTRVAEGAYVFTIDVIYELK